MRTYLVAGFACLVGMMLIPQAPSAFAAHPDAPNARPSDGLVRQYDMEELARFSLDDGWFSADFHVPPSLLRAAQSASPVPLRIPNSAATWGFRTTRDTPDGFADEAVHELSYEDPGSADDPQHVKATLCARDDYLAISAQLRVDDQPVTIKFRSHRDYRSVSLEVSVTNDDSTEPVFNEQADSLGQLFNEHRDEVEHYLSPVLKKLVRRNLLGPECGDVYAVFILLRPDPAATAAVERILPQLDSVDVRERQRASDQLRKLGPPGVLAAMRIDKRLLSPEQRSRLSHFAAAHRHRGDIELARRDVLFLAECLEYDDPAVRAAAKEAIEAVMGRKIAFDPNGDFDARPREVQQLREGFQQLPTAALPRD